MAQSLPIDVSYLLLSSFSSFSTLNIFLGLYFICLIFVQYYNPMLITCQKIFSFISNNSLSFVIGTLVVDVRIILQYSLVLLVIHRL